MKVLNIIKEKRTKNLKHLPLISLFMSSNNQATRSYVVDARIELQVCTHNQEPLVTIASMPLDQRPFGMLPFI